MSVNVDLAYLARVARDVYVAERRAHSVRTSGVPGTWGLHLIPKWDGGDDRRTGRTYRPVWEDVARFAVASGVDVGDLIRARFAVAKGRPPDPTECKNEEAVRILHGWRRAAHDRVVGELSCGTETLLQKTATARDPSLVPARIADDPLADLTPLYRFILALRAGRPDIAAKYQPAAVRQYAGSPEAYDEIWGTLIPPVLRTAYEDVRAWSARGRRNS